MFKSKHWWITFALATVIISPIAIVLSCSSNASTENKPNPEPEPTQPPSAEETKAVADEVNRLNNQTNNLLNQSKWNLSDVTKWQNNPQTLLNSLEGLNVKEFTYQVNRFNLTIQNQKSIQKQTIEQQAEITFQLNVKKNNASLDTKIFTKSINVVIPQPNPDNPDEVKPFFPDEIGVRAQEQKRLDQLQKTTKLSQTYFTDKEIEKLKANPNLILTKLFGFVPQQYFQYQVANGSFVIEPLSKPEAHASHQVRFKINARLWRANNSNTIISSPELSFKILTEDSYSYPEPDRGEYKLKSKKDWNQSEIFEIDLRQNQNVNLAAFEDNDNQIDRIQELIVSAIKKQEDYFFIRTGQLPSTWDWTKQTMVIERTENDGRPINFVDKTNKTLTFDLVVFDAFYPFGSDQEPNDRQEMLSVKFTNMHYDQATKPPAPSQLPMQEQFDNFVKNFQANEMLNQSLNEDFMHSGANGVFQFANLTAESNGQIGRHFSSFLNFSPTELWKATNFKFKPEAIDGSINYLTNEIKFKWKISAKDTSIKPWISDEQIIKYQPQKNYLFALDAQGSTSSDLALAPNALKLTGLLDQFIFNGNYVDKNNQASLLARMGTNWTWKAREFMTFVRFTFFQAFGNNATEINYGIENVPSANLSDNPSGYQVVLKAKIAHDAIFAPYFALVGNLDIGQKHNFKAGDIITIRLNVTNVLETPSVFTDSSEIFPGLSLGETWGSGEGYQAVVTDKPHRTDIFSVQLGTYDMTVTQNNTTILNRNGDVHRFLNFNLLNRYHFTDLFWPEPVDNLWSSSFPASMWENA